MCRVEYYGVRYQDGFVERKERIVHCRRGTRSSQCPNLEYDEDSYFVRPATADEERERMDPWVRTIAPTPESGGRSETTSDAPRPKSKWRRLFGIKEKPRSNKKSGERRSSPAQDPPKKPRGHGSPQSATHPRDRQPRPRREVTIHYPDEDTKSSSSSSEDEQPPLQKPSPERNPELDKSRLYEEQQKHKEKVAKEEAEAQARAQRLHKQQQQEEEQHQQNVGWARKEGKKRRDGRPASYHAIPDEPMSDEALRAQQEQLERDLEWICASDRLAAQHRAESHHHSSATTTTTTEDRRSRQSHRDEEHSARRRRDDSSRLRRQREAGIPCRPHHSPLIHDIRNYDPEDFEEQGSDFIESATRAAERLEAERRRPANEWELPLRGRDGLMRRNTIDGTQREERNGRRRAHRRGGPSY